MAIVNITTGSGATVANNVFRPAWKAPTNTTGNRDALQAAMTAASAYGVANNCQGIVLCDVPGTYFFALAVATSTFVAGERYVVLGASNTTIIIGDGVILTLAAGQATTAKYHFFLFGYPTQNFWITGNNGATNPNAGTIDCNAFLQTGYTIGFSQFGPHAVNGLGTATGGINNCGVVGIRTRRTHGNPIYLNGTAATAFVFPRPNNGLLIQDCYCEDFGEGLFTGVSNNPVIRGNFLRDANGTCVGDLIECGGDINGIIEDNEFIGGGGYAEFTTHLTAGVVTSITISKAGFGYVSAPDLVIESVNGVGSGATATCTVTVPSVASAGYIATITVGAGGSGYTAAPRVRLNGGRGGGACTDVVASQNFICRNNVFEHWAGQLVQQSNNGVLSTTGSTWTGNTFIDVSGAVSPADAVSSDPNAVLSTVFEDNLCVRCGLENGVVMYVNSTSTNSNFTSRGNRFIEGGYWWVGGKGRFTSTDDEIVVAGDQRYVDLGYLQAINRNNVGGNTIQVRFEGLQAKCLGNDALAVGIRFYGDNATAPNYSDYYGPSSHGPCNFTGSRGGSFTPIYDATYDLLKMDPSTLYDGAKFTSVVVGGSAPLTVTFQNLTTYGATSYSWQKSYDGGTTFVAFDGMPSAKTPTEVFTAGIWAIRLTATFADYTSIRTLTSYLTVTGLPVGTLGGFWLNADATVDGSQHVTVWPSRGVTNALSVVGTLTRTGNGITTGSGNYATMAAPITATGVMTMYAVIGARATIQSTVFMGSTTGSSQADLLTIGFAAVKSSTGVSVAVASDPTGVFLLRFRRKADGSCFIAWTGHAEVQMSGSLTGSFITDCLFAAPGEAVTSHAAVAFQLVSLYTEDAVTTGDDPIIRQYIATLNAAWVL